MTKQQFSRYLLEYLNGFYDDSDFRNGFATILRDAHKHGDELEARVHAVEWAFLDMEREVTSQIQLGSRLTRFVDQWNVQDGSVALGYNTSSSGQILWTEPLSISNA